MGWGQDAHPPKTEALFPDLCLPRLTQGPGKMKPAVIGDFMRYSVPPVHPSEAQGGSP